MRSYIDDLNALYNTKIFLKESADLGPEGIGLPYGEYSEECDDCKNGAPMRKCLKCKMPAKECDCDEEEVASEDEIIFSREHPHGEADDFAETGEHPEHKASNMVKQNLYRITKMAAMLYDIIPDDENIEPWVADKLSKATDSINSVLGFKDYEEYKRRVDHDIEIEEKTEQDLYKSIDDGGESLISKIKEIMRGQPRDRVEDAVYGMIKTLEA